MDLIDRSKLKRTEGMFQYQINDAFDRLSASAYRFEDVENAPTIEAIPVEWLCNYAIETDNTDVFFPMFTKWYKEKENESKRVD